MGIVTKRVCDRCEITIPRKARDGTVKPIFHLSFSEGDQAPADKGEPVAVLEFHGLPCLRKATIAVEANGWPTDTANVIHHEWAWDAHNEEVAVAAEAAEAVAFATAARDEGKKKKGK